jgi:WD40 repeat protein
MLNGELWTSAEPECTRAALWRLEDGSRQMLLRGHRGNLRDAAFSPDGLNLATGLGRGLVRVWKAVPWPSSEEEFVKYKRARYRRWLELNRSGREQ